MGELSKELRSLTNRLLKVIQKLMEFGTQDQRAGLARIVENEIVDLSLNVWGCRVVQKVNISD